MKFFCMLILAAGLAAESPLDAIRKVYVFPMRSGLEQYLVSALTERHVFEVVSDPKAADAVLTDRVGAAFEEAFDRLVLEKKAKGDEQVRNSTLSAARGTVFLVSRDKRVVWSAYIPAKDSTARELEKAAKKTAARLEQEVHPALPPAPR